MKRVTRAFFAFVAAFLIVFSTLGNAFFVARAMEPTTVVATEGVTTGGETSADTTVLLTDDKKSDDEKAEDKVTTSDKDEEEESEEAESDDAAKTSDDTKTAEKNDSESAAPSAAETADTAEEKILVTATPAAGEVEKGTKVELSCSVEGAVIKYNVGGAAFKEYDAEKGIVVNEDVTIKAYATLDENSDDGADPLEFKYTVKVKAEEDKSAVLKSSDEATYDDEATELKNGDKVILVAQSYALTSTPSASNAKLSTTELSKDDDGKILVNEDAAVLTVESKDGLVAFKNADGKYLSTPGQFKQGLGFTSDCTNESWWVLEGLKSGFNVKSNYTQFQNTDGKFQYIGIGSDNKKDVFSVLTLKSNDKFIIHFYYADGAASEAASVEAPKASVESGSKVEFGEEVELTCATEGAKIFYSTTGKDGSFAEYSEKIAVTGNTTISAYAEVEGDVKSEVVDFTYELVEGTKITDLTKLADDQEFVLVFGNDKAMTTTANGKKLEGYDVKVNEDSHLTAKALGTSESGEAIEPAVAKLKLVAAETEGQYYITTDVAENDATVTKYLTSGETGNSLTFEADKKVVEDKDYSLWAIEAEENGAFLIKSVNAEFKGKAQYMEFYSALFTVYGYTAGSAKTAYTFMAYTFPELEMEEVQEPENTVAKLLTRKLYDGDKVVIYYPTDGKAMTAEANNGKLKDVAVTVAEDKTIETKDTNAAVFTVSADENGNYTFQTADGKFLAGEITEKEQSDGTKKTYTNLILADEKNDDCAWTQEKASEEGKYYLKSANLKYNDKVQALEYYKGFALYGFKETNIYEFSFYALSEGEEPAEVEEPLGTAAKLLTREFYNGDKVVVYYPASKTLMTSELNNGKFKAVSAEPAEGVLETKDLNALVLTVTVDENGQYTLKSADGKYLTATVEKNESTGKTYCGLALDEAASDNSVWYLNAADDKKEGNFYLMSAHGKNGSYDLALEYYSGFTSYGFKEDKAYVFNFYALKEGEKVVKLDYDKEVNLAVAQWAGNAHYDEVETSKEYINGDLYKTNDMLDKNAKYSAVVGGAVSQPWTSAKSSNTGSTNYYMGSTGVISSATDYMQFELSTLGYANMGMEFRMRGSNTAAGSFQLQYSTDGENFKNFKTGKYSYKYTAYKTTDKVDENGKAVQEPFEVNGSGDITDGIAKTSLAPTYYVTFKFDIPNAAANAEKVYIRLTPVEGTLSAKGDKAPAKGGVIRLDGVKINANPVIDDSVTGFVKATPASGEVALGEEITLTSSTEGADIFYSVNGGEFVKYDDADKLSFTELPATLSAYATKAGLSDSVMVSYQYTQAQVAAVKANPNGGAVFENQYVSLKTATKDATILYRFRTAEEIAKDDASADKDEKETSEGKDASATEETKTEDETAAEEEEFNDWKVASSSIQLTQLPCQIQVKAVKNGYKDSAVSTLKYTKKLNDRYNIYFGQVHAHTSISDGSGTLAEAYEHASKVDNLDYIVITDHSNSIDNEKESVISQNVDKADTDEWTYAHNLAKQYTTDDFTCAYGYEMTWSNGLGHMNTFNTPGFQSRTQTEYSTYATALQNYYASLRTVPDSVSQFNHPGTTFGDFQDFAYYTEENDALITMIEVGNGEGTIGSSGYFPSYEYYTRALDKGWHVAPTNNQDNHKGKWGDANTARTVMLADTNDEEAIYDAMRNYRIYATEDNDLSIYYTLEGNIMGSILEKDAVGDHLNIKADITDPTDSKIGKVEVIVNGGQSIASKDVNSNSETVEFIVPSHYSYYYLKITEPDGNIAVTAPVWVGEVEACGINRTYTNTVLPVKGESLDVNVDFYNNEESELKIDNINIVVKDVDNKETEVVNVTGEDAGLASVASQGTATFKTDFVYTEAGQVTYEVTVNATLNGVSKVYSDKLQLSYTVPDMVTDVIIDGTHFNDYVTGYYGGNMSAFISICAKKNIRAEVVTDSKELTAERLAKTSLFVISAPAKKSGTANAGDYTVSHFSDEFIAMVKDYVANGGSVIVCGLADYSDTTDGQTATEQNKLLEAIGSTIRMGSDEVCDDTNNGGQVYRMYPVTYNLESGLLNGVVLPETDENGNVTKEGQRYSQYSGCSVDVSNATATDFVEAAEWLVKGYDTTYSVDCKDAAGNAQPGTLDNGVKGIKNDNQGNVTFLATQKTKAGGRITVAGGVFVSDFEVKAEMDNNDSLPFTNYTIANNILDGVTVELPTSTIAQARAGAMNEVFAVEGYVTSGTDNKNTTFFDTIYIQDETAGIDIFPYATPGLAIGTKMRIVGYVSQYQGDKELKVISSKILDADPYVWEPKEVSTKDAMDYDALGGSLLKTTGKVTRVALASDGKTIEEFWLQDDTGVEAAIFIDGYIYSATTGKNELADFVKVGAEVSAAGVLYMHPEGDSEVSVPVFRVRNCDDIQLVKAAPTGSASASSGNSGSGSNGGSSSGSSSGSSDNGGNDSSSSDNGSSSGSSSNSSSQTPAPTVLGAVKEAVQAGVDTAKEVYTTVFNALTGKNKENALTENSTNGDETGEVVGDVTGIEDEEVALSDTPAEQIEQPSENTGEGTQTPDAEQTTIEEEQTPKADSVVPKGVKVAAAVAGFAAVVAGIGVAIKHLIAALIVK